jgi:hypothetical protein
VQAEDALQTMVDGQSLEWQITLRGAVSFFFDRQKFFA